MLIGREPTTRRVCHREPKKVGKNVKHVNGIENADLVQLILYVNLLHYFPKSCLGVHTDRVSRVRQLMFCTICTLYTLLFTLTYSLARRVMYNTNNSCIIILLHVVK